VGCRFVIHLEVIPISFAILIAAEVLRLERIPLTDLRQMLRHNPPKTAVCRESTQTRPAESDAPDLPVPQFEQEAL
jgi:hypothetical protein